MRGDWGGVGGDAVRGVMGWMLGRSRAGDDDTVISLL